MVVEVFRRQIVRGTPLISLVEYLLSGVSNLFYQPLVYQIEWEQHQPAGLLKGVVGGDEGLETGVCVLRTGETLSYSGANLSDSDWHSVYGLIPRRR